MKFSPQKKTKIIYDTVMKLMAALYVFSLLIIASVVTQTSSYIHGISYYSLRSPQRKSVKNVVSDSSDSSFSDIAFDLPDIAINVETLDGQYLLEAFKSVDNDAILNEAGVPRASQLRWVSVGQPVPVFMQNESKVFHWATYGFYAHFQMLTDAHRRILAKTASEIYNVNVKASQVVSLALSKFECNLPVYDVSHKKYLIKGTISDFKTFPLRMDFPVLPGTTERQLLKSIFKHNHDNIDTKLVCLMASRGKKFTTNTLSITSKQSEQIGLSEKLFGPSSTGGDTVYVSREQTAQLYREIYSTLNIVEAYEMPESAFSEAFISEFISQTAISTFSFVPTDDALASLSAYTLDLSGDIKPDIIKRDLSSILKTQSYGDKSRIIVDEEQLKKLQQGDKDYGGASVGGFGVQGSVNWGRENTKGSESHSKSRNDQLKELNAASKSDIQWEFEGEKIVPKSLNVVRLLRRNLNKTLTFRRVRIQKTDAPFNLKFAVYTSHTKASTPKLDRLNDRVTDLLKEIGEYESANNASVNQIWSDVRDVQSGVREVQSNVTWLSSNALKKCNLCFRETTGSCSGSRHTCTNWVGGNRTSAWTSIFHDHTKSGYYCAYQWYLACTA